MRRRSKAEPSYLSPVERAAQDAWKPQDIRMPWQWCEDNVIVPHTSPMPGPWRSNNAPWVKPIYEVAADKRVSQITVKCSVQSSKTETALGVLFWAIAEDPGPAMYVMANKEDSEDFVRDRFSLALSHCAPAEHLLLRQTKLSFTFRTMPLYFLGAGSTAKLQGKPMKKLFLDEVRNWPPGALETVKKRVVAFGKLSLIFILSTPGPKGDAVDQAFTQGDQRTFHFPCPKCGTMQQLRFDQLKAEHPETHLCVKWSDIPSVRNQETGQWNFELLGKAIRFQCCNSKCGHLISDTPTERKAICRGGSFIRMNPNAEPCDVSFTWNALLPWWVSWGKIAKEFIQARAAARLGNIEPMRTFITETLAESWEDRLGIVEDFGFLEARRAPYDYGEAWPEAERRYMAADVQEKGGRHFWWLIEDVGLNGKSRIVSHGRAATFEEIEQVRKEHSVATADSMIDSGYAAQEVYRFCVATGWKPFKGEDREYYLIRLQDPRNPAKTITVRRMWDRSRAVVYNAQTKARIGQIPLYLFSNQSSNDLLQEYMQGLVGDWTLPKNAAKELLRQLAGDVRLEHKDSKGVLSWKWHTVGDNHYRDCERMILMAKLVTKMINAGPQVANNSRLEVDGRDSVTGQAGQTAAAV